MTYRDAIALVADDHELFRAALAGMLRAHVGFRSVLEAGTLDEALGHLGRESDLAFAAIDLGMPGMAGAASVRAIRRSHPTLRLAVVTASERREDILQALDAGVNGYVPKTLPTAALTAALRAILEGGIFVPPVLAECGVHQGSGTASPAPEAEDAGLSPRQRDVMQLIALGKSNKEIARALNLATGTVKVHVNAIYRAVGASNRVTAVAAVARRRSTGVEA